MIGDPNGRAQQHSLLSATMARSNAENFSNGSSAVLDWLRYFGRFVTRAKRTQSI